MPQTTTNLLPKGWVMAQPKCGKVIAYGATMYRVNNTGTKYGGSIFKQCNTKAYAAILAIAALFTIKKGNLHWAVTYSKCLYLTPNGRGRLLNACALHLSGGQVQLHVATKFASYLQPKGVTVYEQTHSSMVNMVGLNATQMQAVYACVKSAAKAINSS